MLVPKNCVRDVTLWIEIDRYNSAMLSLTLTSSVLNNQRETSRFLFFSNQKFDR